MADTIRNQILDFIVDKFSKIEEGVDLYTISWGRVNRYPPFKDEERDDTYLAIIDGAETVARTVTFVDSRTLRVFIEFYLPLQEGECPSTRLNTALGEIIRCASEDRTAGGLSLNIEDDGNELDIAGPENKVASGVVVINVLYRTRTGDPTLKC